MKKILFVTSVLLILENLSFGFFIDRIFSWSRQHKASLLNTAAGSALKSASPSKTSSVFERGEEDCLIEKDIAEIFSKTFLTIGYRYPNKVVLKVPRYIFKSVLNI